MRTNIEIDDRLMDEAMAAGGFKTKKEAVEAGLMLLKRQAAMRELAKMGGKVSWGWGDEERLDGQPNWTAVDAVPVAAPYAAESLAGHQVRQAAVRKPASAPAPAPTRKKPHAGR